jgi:hypothetical protein
MSLLRRSLSHRAKTRQELVSAGDKDTHFALQPLLNPIHQPAFQHDLHVPCAKVVASF